MAKQKVRMDKQGVATCRSCGRRWSRRDFAWRCFQSHQPLHHMWEQPHWVDAPLVAYSTNVDWDEVEPWHGAGGGTGWAPSIVLGHMPDQSIGFYGSWTGEKDGTSS